MLNRGKNWARISCGYLALLLILISIPQTTIAIEGEALDHANDPYWNRVSLSAIQNMKIIDGMKQSVFNSWAASVANSINYEKEAALIVLRKAIHINTADYLMKTAPIEIGIEMAKTVKSIYGWTKVDGIIDILKKAGTNTVKKEALGELKSYLEDKKIYVGRAGVEMKYPTLASGGKESQEVHLSFIILYDFNQQKAHVSIYSPKEIYTPEIKAMFQWTGDVDKLPPFILEINGSTKDSHDFFWNSNDIDINYINNRPVPDLAFQNVGWLEDQFNKKKNQFISTMEIAVNTLDAIGNVVVDGIMSAGQSISGAVKNATSYFKDLLSFSTGSILGINSLVSNPTTTHVSPRPMIEEEVEKKSTAPTTPATLGQKTMSDEEEAERTKLMNQIAELEAILKDLQRQLAEKEGVIEKTGQIDVNTASAKELEKLTGIGPSLAQRIIEGRIYCSIDDLERVNGIGATTIRNIKDQGLAWVQPDICEEIEEEEIEEEELEEEDAPSNACPTKVDINKASIKELECLVGIGATMAQRIVSARYFCSVDDLVKVSGIGTATLGKIKAQGLAWTDGSNCSSGGGGGATPPPAAAPIPEESRVEKVLTPLWITEIQRLPTNLSKEADQVYPLSSRFFEIYNPNDKEIDLTGWYIQRSTSGTLGSFISKTILDGYIIPAKSHLLFSPEKSLNPHIETNLTITENNAFAIKNPDGKIVDLVGYGTSPLFWGSSFPASPGYKESLSRKWENGEYVNTENNANDFEISLMPSPGRENNLVYIPSSRLRQTVKENLGLASDEITREDMADLRKISNESGKTNKQVLDLTGLEWAVNLEEASFVIDGITDISPLSGLTSIKYLDLSYNEIEDWSPLEKLTNLKELRIKENKGYDLAPLSGLTSLEIFSASHIMQDELSRSSEEVRDIRRTRDNPFYRSRGLAGSITDISFVSNLANLKEFHIGGHKVTDASPLSNLQNLEKLCLNHNQIGPAISLSNLPKIREVYLDSNPLVDISGLAGLGPLDIFSIGGIPVVPEIPLIGEIDLLNISGGKIEDLSSLVNNQNKINYLDLSDNSITNSILPGSSFGGEIESINLSGNQLTSDAPFFQVIKSKNLFLSDMSTITSIPLVSDSVKKLNVGGRQKTFDFSNLKDLQYLEELSISMIDMEEIPSDISGHIKSLSFNLGGIRNLPCFSGLTKIEKISIPMNNIESSDLIQAQPKELILFINKITDISPFVNVFRTAEKVDLSTNQIEDFEPLKAALDNPNIVINIYDNNIDRDLFREAFQDHPRFNEWSY